MSSIWEWEIGHTWRFRVAELFFFLFFCPFYFTDDVSSSSCWRRYALKGCACLYNDSHHGNWEIHFGGGGHFPHVHATLDVRRRRLFRFPFLDLWKWSSYTCELRIYARGCCWKHRQGEAPWVNEIMRLGRDVLVFRCCSFFFLSNVHNVILLFIIIILFSLLRDSCYKFRFLNNQYIVINVNKFFLLGRLTIRTCFSPWKSQCFCLIFTKIYYFYIMCINDQNSKNNEFMLKCQLYQLFFMENSIEQSSCRSWHDHGPVSRVWPHERYTLLAACAGGFLPRIE